MTEMSTRCSTAPARWAAWTRFRVLTSSPLGPPARCSTVCTPSSASSRPSPVIRSTAMYSTPSPGSRSCRLSTRTLCPACRRSGTTCEPRSPVPPVTRTLADIFVLHDMFDVAFDDIAHMMERNAAAVRQLASRARVKVRGTGAPTADPARRRQAVEAYLAATRTGDFKALLTLLDPEVELRADAAVTGATKPLTLQGALAVARSALAAVPRARFTARVLVDGSPALVMAPLGQLSLVIQFTFTGTAITAIDITADSDRLQAFDITLD